MECGDNLTCQDFHSKLYQFIEDNKPKDEYISWKVKYDVELEKTKMIVSTRQQIIQSIDVKIGLTLGLSNKGLRLLHSDLFGADLF